MLNPTVFSRISCRWILTIDLFASAWNRQLESFVSWQPQPSAEGVDAFSLDWHQLQAYAFLPFSLIQRCLGKVRRSSRTDVSSSLLANTAVVPLAVRASVRNAFDNSARGGSPSRPNRFATPPSGEGRPASNRLAIIRGKYEARGLPEGVISYLLAADRASTSATYQSAWNAWIDWSFKRDQDPLSPSLNEVLIFLSSLADHGKAYRSINVYRSMLSATVDKIDGFNVGKHPLVTRLMKGIFSSNPPSAKYSGFWDINTVLVYLDSLGPNVSLNFKQLSLKLTILFAITSLCRVSELAAIEFSSITVSDFGV